MNADSYLLVLVSLLIVLSILVRGQLKNKINKAEILIFLINLVLTIVCIFLYENIISANETLNLIYDIYRYINYSLLVIWFLLLSIITVTRSKEHQLFINSIKNTNWNVYYVVDKKERIKDISLSLLKELDMNRSDCIGEKLFNVFNKSLRFTKLNGVDTTNKSLEHYYEEYNKRVKKGDSEKEELFFYNYKGELIALNSGIEPVFSLNKYAGRVLVGEIKTDFDLLSVEKNLNNAKEEINSLNEKLIGIFETSNDGLFSVDLDEKYIWCSDALLSLLKLENNTVDLNTFRSRIEPTDLKKYLLVLSSLTANNPFYSVAYRIDLNGTYGWFKEKGKRIFESSASATIIGTISELKTRHYLSSDIDNLDSLLSKEELMVLLKRLKDEKKYFHLAIFKIDNVPDINLKYGRGVGNLVLSEYVTNLKETFVTESTDIFRIQGLEFAVPITEPRKAELLKKGSQNDAAFLNKTVSYGSITFEVIVYAGISVYPDDAKDEFILFEDSEKALKQAFTGKNNICFYEDIS